VAPNAADSSQIDFQVEWLEPPGVEAPCTMYSLCEPMWANCSILQMPGFPSEAQANVATRFLDLPILTSGQDRASVGPPLRSAIEFVVFDPEATVFLVLSSAEGKVPGWLIEAPSSMTSITVPQAPGGVDLKMFFGVDYVAAVLKTAELDELGHPKREAYLAPFMLSLP
jgi:hypothetical protein